MSAFFYTQYQQSQIQTREVAVKKLAIKKSHILAQNTITKVLPANNQLADYSKAKATISDIFHASYVSDDHKLGTMTNAKTEQLLLQVLGHLEDDPNQAKLWHIDQQNLTFSQQDANLLFIGTMQATNGKRRVDYTVSGVMDKSGQRLTSITFGVMAKGGQS